MLIVFRCANGLVSFRVLRKPTYPGFTVYCLTDGSVARILVPPLSNIEVALQHMGAKAVALRGAIVQVFELESFR